MKLVKLLESVQESSDHSTDGDLSVEKTDQGAWRISAMVDGRRVSHQYFDMERDEAIAAFREDNKLNESPQKAPANIVGWKRGTFSLDGRIALLSCGCSQVVPEGTTTADPVRCETCNPTEFTGSIEAEVEFEVVSWDLDEYPYFGRGDAPSFEEMEAQMPQIMKRFDKVLRRFPKVKAGEKHVEYHDEVDGEWMAAIHMSLSGPEADLRAIGAAGNDEDWWIHIGDD